MDSETFGKYLAEAFGKDRTARILEALEESPSVSLRFNPLKPAAGGCEVEALSDGAVPWCGEGVFLGSRPTFTLDPVFHAGGYYVQDSSSMFVGYVFRQIAREMKQAAEEDGRNGKAGCLNGNAGQCGGAGQPHRDAGQTGGTGCLNGNAGRGDGAGQPHGKAGQPSGKAGQPSGKAGRVIRVLDLCAAPGGKTTDLAASLRGIFGDRFFLVSNEVMKSRASALADNAARWGDPNVAVTSADPAAFAALEGFFDIILADVPCSGEGMFRKDSEAVRQWSEDTVALCAARQKRILADVWPALSEGGALIYSTCTFNRLENDGNVEWAADELGAEILTPDCPFEEVIRTRHGFSLVPGFVRGEGQYCAALRKSGRSGGRTSESSPGRTNTGWTDSGRAEAEKLEGLFTGRMAFRRRGELTVAVPEIIGKELDALERILKPLSAGVAVGTDKCGKLVPSADLALSAALGKEAFLEAEVSRETALSFLHRDCIVLKDAPQGYVAVTFKGLRLGFVKNIGTRCNNLLPPRRRIIMDVD